jgi:peptide-methionine (S)-S-oxide reductase
VTNDASQVTFGQLRAISVAQNARQLNRQGPGAGTQRRSAAFVASREQERVARAYMAQLDESGGFGAERIATPVRTLDGFYASEAYNQGYARKHPDELYIRFIDAPKVINLKKQLPELYVDR